MSVGARVAPGTERFSQQQRLKAPADYQRVFDNPRRSADGYLLILARDNGLPLARLGLALARKKIPTAAARNRVKRIVRESFRKHQQQLTGLDVVVLARTDLSHVANQVLFDSLATHWDRLAGRRQLRQ